MLETAGSGGEVKEMFNNKKIPGFSMQGAWPQVFCHFECTQKMEKRKVRLIFLNLFL